MDAIRLVSHLRASTEDGENGSPIEIIYAGTFFHDAYGEFEVTPEHIGEMVRNFKAMDGPDRVPIDCNHGSLSEGVEAAVAVGWLQEIYQRDQDGRLSLMGTPRWNESTKELIEDEAYKYLSAELVFNDTNSLTGEKIGARLLAVALTNRPFIPELEPVHLTAPTDQVSRVARTVSVVKSRRESGGMVCGDSLIAKLDALASAFYSAYPDSPDFLNVIEDIETDALIVVQMKTEGGVKIFSVPYSEKDSGYSFGEWTEVEKQYEPKATANSTTPGDQLTDPPTNAEKEEPTMDEAQVRELLGIGEDDSIEDAIAALKDAAAEVATLTERVEALTGEVETLTAGKSETDAELETAQAELTARKDEVVTLNQTRDEGDAERVQLSERVTALEAEKSERDTKDRIHKALNDGRVTPAELDAEEGFLRTLAQDQPDTFEKIMAVRPANPVHDVELSDGESEDGDADEPTLDRFYEMVGELRDANPELKQADARAQVLESHPEYEAVANAAAEPKEE